MNKSVVEREKATVVHKINISNSILHIRHRKIEKTRVYVSK